MASSDISNRASLGLPSDNTHGRACLGLPSDNTHAHWQAKEVFKHIERLKYQDEDWQARDASLQRLCKLVHEGALSSDGFVSGFAVNLKELVHSVVTQLFDLRSVIARSAVATLSAILIECGDHAAAEKPFKEDALEGLLQLAASGNTVLAAAGRDCLPTFVESVRFESVVKDGLLHWLRNKQIPVKLCCLNALMQALQTWPVQLLGPSNEVLEAGLVEAAAHPAAEVRTLARQCLLQHLENVPARADAVEKLMARYPDTKKKLAQESISQAAAVAAAERAAPATVRRGEGGAKRRNGKLGVSKPSGEESDAGAGGVDRSAAASTPSGTPRRTPSKSGTLSGRKATPPRRAGASSARSRQGRSPARGIESKGNESKGNESKGNESKGNESRGNGHPQGQTTPVVRLFPADAEGILGMPVEVARDLLAILAEAQPTAFAEARAAAEAAGLKRLAKQTEPELISNVGGVAGEVTEEVVGEVAGEVTGEVAGEVAEEVAEEVVDEVRGDDESCDVDSRDAESPCGTITEQLLALKAQQHEMSDEEYATRR